MSNHPRSWLALAVLLSVACPPPYDREETAEGPIAPRFECPETPIYIGLCDTGVPDNAAGTESCLQTEVYECLATAHGSGDLGGCLEPLSERLAPEQFEGILGCAAAAPAGAMFREEVDGGDDPFVGGCHYVYGDPACTVEKKFHNPEWCISTTELVEWTDPGCHPRLPLDRKQYDCDALCKARGREGGFCTMGLAPPCDGVVQTAQCVCF